MIIKNKKGQAFEAYKLLIAFVIAAAILGIIAVMISKTNNQAVVISYQKIENSFSSAINSPIISMEKPFVVKDVLISGIISYNRFEQLGNIEPGCFGLITGPGITKEAYGAMIEKKYLKTDIYFRCGLGEMNDSLIPNDIWPGVTNYEPFDQDPTILCEKLFCVMYINKIPSDYTP